MTVDLNTKTCPPDDPNHSGEHICGAPDHYHVNGYPSGCFRCDPDQVTPTDLKRVSGEFLDPDTANLLCWFINSGGTFKEI